MGHSIPILGLAVARYNIFVFTPTTCAYADAASTSESINNPATLHIIYIFFIS
ncbi:hypothetical protein [Phocaeicola sp.]